jgi:hypothetical protein
VEGNEGNEGPVEDEEEEEEGEDDEEDDVRGEGRKDYRISLCVLLLCKN